jgi:hypothetical protein
LQRSFGRHEGGNISCANFLSRTGLKAGTSQGLTTILAKMLTALSNWEWGYLFLTIPYTVLPELFTSAPFDVEKCVACHCLQPFGTFDSLES